MTSGIALSIGEDRAEFVTDAIPELLPILLLRIFLMLGVRAIPRDCGGGLNSAAFFPWTAVAAVRV